MAERLQKLLARAGLGSRRESEALIEAGRVRVNGKVARLGDRADPAGDTITVDDRPLKFEPLVYVLLHKPKGVLSSTEDELKKGRPTVRDLVDVPGHLYPVGRLDSQSRGLMLLTNDGDLAHRLTHPRYSHSKVYRVVVAGRPTAETLTTWAQGVMLDGKRTRSATVEVVEQLPDRTHLRITMREGRKRQIRRVAAMLGHPVRNLLRIQLGILQLGRLPPGQWRHLTPAEVTALKKSVGSGPAKRQPRPGRKSKPTRGPAARKPASPDATPARRRRAPARRKGPAGSQASRDQKRPAARRPDARQQTGKRPARRRPPRDDDRSQ